MNNFLKRFLRAPLKNKIAAFVLTFCLLPLMAISLGFIEIGEKLKKFVDSMVNQMTVWVFGKEA
jgi:hypothetical protein